MDESSKQYTAFTIGNLGFFECKCIPFGLCNAPATFQKLMQNCLGELNLIYCLIYLDDIVIFLHTAEEHLHHLCVVFDQFRERSVKLKPSKCNFFREEITSLAHWVSKDGVQPSNSNLKTFAECAPSHTYTEVHAFLGLVGHYRRFIKGFTCIAQPLNDHLTEEGASRESENVLLSGCPEGFWDVEAGMYDSPCASLHWLYQAISARDGCIKRETQGSAVPETGGQMISPSHLWQQIPHPSWEELPLN